MKNSVNLHSLCFVILVIFLHSCKKEELPTLSTSTISNITATSASGGGNITSDGGAEVSARGVCWGINANPTTSDSYTNDGKGIGQFVSSISGLNGGSTYHIRAYATNPVGTAYGADMTFSTLGQAPSAATQSATNVTATSATLNAIVNANYLSTIVTFDYGTTASYGQTITVTQSPVTGNTNTTVTAELTGLAEGTTYHFSVKTVNSLGTTNGNDISLITLGQAPTAVTLSACCLSTTGAKLNGTVNANYVSTTVTFEYGLITTYGSSVIATPSPVTGNSSTSVSANISGLNFGTTYHFRIKAVNSLGTTYGSDMEFTTPFPPPPTNGLVAYYPFNQNAADESGNNRHGTVMQAIPVADRFGSNNKAYGFDGNNGTERYIYSNIGIHNTITFCVWVKSPYPTTWYPTIMNYGTSNAIQIQFTGNNPTYITNGSDGKIHAGSIINDGPNWSTHVLSDNKYVDNNWHFVVVTFVPNDKLYLYVDNQLIKTSAYTLNIPTIDLLYIGRTINDEAAGPHTSHYNGSIDDIRIYNRALSTDEISSLYNEIP